MSTPRTTSAAADIIPIGRARRLADQAATLRGSEPLAPESHRVRTLAVSGGKGGTGKSVVAANLAVAFGQRGGRSLAVDADLGMADLNLLLGLAPGKSLMDVMGGSPIEDVLVDVHGISLLPALNGSFSLANMSLEDRHALFAAIDSLDDRFDTLVIDTGPGIDENAINFAAAASDVVVVITPDSLSLADAYSSLKALQARQGVQRACVLPNKVRSPSEATDLFERLAGLVDRFLGMSLVPLPAIPFDQNVADSAEIGVPVLISHPDSAASRALVAVTRRLDALSEPDERAGGVRLFLRKTFAAEQEVG